MQNFEVDPFGTGRVLVVGVHGTWMSSNKGGDWIKIAPALTGEPNSATTVAFSLDPAKIYMAFGNGQIYRTVNGGGNGKANNWTDISQATNWGGTIISVA